MPGILVRASDFRSHLRKADGGGEFLNFGAPTGELHLQREIILARSHPAGQPELHGRTHFAQQSALPIQKYMSI